MINNFVRVLKKHIQYILVMLFVTIISIVGIVLECKRLAIIGLVLVCIVSVIDKYKSDITDCGEY